MSMTKSRRRVYNRGWYDRECRFDMRKRRREYHKRARAFAKLVCRTMDENLSLSQCETAKNLDWNTLS